MSDYIKRADASALCIRIVNKERRVNSNGFVHFFEAIDIAEEFRKIPSVNIVRCKECKWRNKYGCHNPKWGDGWANYPPPNPQDDDFCSYGERRYDE